MDKTRRREYDKAYLAKCKQEDEELERKLELLKLRREDEIRAQNVVLRGREESVALLRHNYGRGMSERRMNDIWGRQFVQAVLMLDLTM